MSDTTLETQHVLDPGDRPQSGPNGSPTGTRPWWLRHVWWLVGVAIVLVSIVSVIVLKTRPGYDPYGWLIWGYQTLHLSLDLGGAPSWKPLTLLFTVPFSLFGHDALWLWMVTAEAVSFAGSIFAGRIAYRIVNADGKARNAAIFAALFAGLGMYGIQDNINGTLDSYVHYLLSVQSDPMIVTLVLAAIDMHMLKHRRWTIAVLTLAGLGRPEVWPILGLYGLWCWVKRPDMRLFLGVCAFLTVFLWFGVPTITNGRPFVAGDLAQGSPRECVSGKVICTIDRFKTLNLWPVWVLAFAAIGWAGYRYRRLRAAAAETLSPDQRTERVNQRLVLGLTVCILIWLIVEVAFALHGWPAVPRYIFEPAVVAILLGGIGFGWLLREIPRSLHVPAWAGVVVAVVLALALIPGARARFDNEHRDLRSQRVRTASINQLQTFIDRLGGRQAVLNCGRPVTNVEYVSIIGWLTDLNDGKVGHRPQFELHQHYPIVLFTQLPNGWAAWPWHTAQSKLGVCQGMKKVYTVAKGASSGVLSSNNVAPVAVPAIADTPTPG